MKLNHLVFASYLIIFCKGEDQSIQLCLRALATFAAASGLIANSGKSAMYTCNMASLVKRAVLQNSGFTEGTLPFKYLGININAKKISKGDCQILIDKVVARLRTWGFSYAGRALLVNSVLLTLHSYWASIFIIPKAVIDGIITVIINSLWDGKAVSSRTPPIAWDLVCRKKKQGGLGFKESHAWNLAMVGKYVWNIACKAENLWVQWINHVYFNKKAGVGGTTILLVMQVGIGANFVESRTSLNLATLRANGLTRRYTLQQVVTVGLEEIKLM
jgi:hypothetical protein